MEYVNKQEIKEKLERLINARKNKPCNRQALVESQAFRYCIAIVDSLEVYETDNDI